IGCTFKEAFLKRMRSLETNKDPGSEKIDKDLIQHKLTTPTPNRIPYLLYAITNGFSVPDLMDLTHIDPWFLNEMREITDTMKLLGQHTINSIPPELLHEAKESGFDNARIAQLLSTKAHDVATKRKNYAITPVYKHVDTCATEF